MDGPPKFKADGNLTPDFYAVNTMQPPYQPSANLPALGGDPRFADPAAPTTMPPQTAPTIGDLLFAQGVSWAGNAAPGNTSSTTATPSPSPPSSTTTSPSTISRTLPPAPRRAPSTSATAA